MGYTLLQLVDQSTGEMGLTQPSAIIGSGNNQVKQLLALCQRLGKDLAREFEWRQLVKAYQFQTEASSTLSGSWSANDATVTVASTATLEVGNVVSGTNIQTYNEVLSITDGTHFELAVAPESAGSSVTLTFAVQDYALPSDFDRMVSNSQWDRENRWPNRGTTSSQDWQSLQGSTAAPGVRSNFRIYGTKLRLIPAPTTVRNMAYEYVSTFWVTATGGTSPSKATFTVDTDTFIYPDDLMLAGLKYYFLKAKKLDFGIEQAEFNDILSKCKAQDVPVSEINLTPASSVDPLGPSLADGSWSL